MTAAAMLAMFMVMMVLVFQLFQGSSNSCLTFHSTNQLSTGQFAPRSGNNSSILIMLTEHIHSLIQLFLGNSIGTGQNDGGCGFHLVVIELAKVLHINLDLAGIRNSYGVAQFHIGYLFHSADDIGQLTNTGGLDDHTVGMILGNNLLQSLAEIAHQAAADATGIHLSDVDTGILQEAAVDADLAEFIFDENQLLATVSFCDHFLDKGGFTGTQKAGVNIDLCHSTHLLYIKFLFYYITLFPLCKGNFVASTQSPCFHTPKSATV